MVIASNTHQTDVPNVGSVTLKIPDPLNCLPARARRQHGAAHNHPYWRPITSEVEGVATMQPPHWEIVSVAAVEPHHHVTFRRKQSTFSFLSRKNGYTQTGESPWELVRAQELEVDPITVDFQLGSLRVYWRTDNGDRFYTADNVSVTASGLVTAEEIKASASYFHDADYSELMGRIKGGLNAVGIEFRKVDADQMRDNRRRRYNISAAFDDRFAAFSERHLDALSNEFAKNSAGVALGELTEAFDLPGAKSQQIINAMMCKRHLAYDLDLSINRDTQIVPVANVTKSIPDIRAILRR